METPTQPAQEPVAREPEAAPVSQPKVQDQQDFPVRGKSYVYPAGEILCLTIGLNLTARAIGYPWAKTTASTIEGNLDPGAWHFDSDEYTINNAGHSYWGAVLFSSARSTGHNWWVSGLYAFGGSLVWETTMETSRPSLNDQITTPFGGMFIGEVMHRTSRALLYPGYGKPNWLRRTAAALIDPVATVNRATFGDPWTRTNPPSMYAHFAIGVQQASHVMGEGGPGRQLHTAVFLEHGLTGDRAFQPRHAMDQFELRASLDSSADDLDFTFNVRGLLIGTGKWSPRLRGMGGLFGAYDFNNQEFVRASMLGIGPGATAELQIGRYGYLESTLAAYAVPWGSAGGYTEREKLGRDYHRGPGLAQLFELKGGRRGIASLRSTTRAYQIAARLAGDDTNEIVIRSTLATELHLATHHAIGIEGTYGWRRASRTDGFMDTISTETANEIRAFYSVTMDEILGR